MKHGFSRFVLLVLVFCFTFSLFGAGFASGDPPVIQEPEVVFDGPADDQPVGGQSMEEDAMDPAEEVMAEEASGPVVEEGGAAPSTVEDAPNYVPGVALAVFEPGADVPMIERMAEDSGRVLKQTVDGAQGSMIGVIGLAEGESVTEAVASLEQTPGVLYAQPNYIYGLAGGEASYRAALPSDPLVGDQWYLNKVGASEAYGIIDALPGGEKVLVAVLDTIVDINHEDLRGIINPSLCVSVQGGDIRPYGKDVDDFHGTHVSGIIGAAANNGLGIAGMGSGGRNQVLELMSVDISEGFDNYIWTYTYDVVAGIGYAVESGAQVINMSFTGYGNTPYPDNDKLIRSYMDWAFDQGVTLVAAAGNDDTNYPATPSDFQTVISVIATTDYDDPGEHCKADFSNYGASKDVSAPGVGVLSCLPDNDYGYAQGTSMASPIVAGVAAMMKYANPDLTPTQVKEILIKTATDLNSPGYDYYTAYGNVNAPAAINLAIEYGKNPPQPEPAPIPAPEPFTATADGPNKITLDWSGAEGSEGYYIRRSEYKYPHQTDKYIVLEEALSPDILTYTDTSVKTGVTYHYMVSGGKYDESGKRIDGSGYTAGPKSATPVLDAPKSLSPKGADASTINVKWEAVRNANGYYVYRSLTRSGGYALAAAISNGKTVSYKDAGLKANTKYYYKVMAYTQTDNGKVKGKTAGPIAAQTKKAAEAVVKSEEIIEDTGFAQGEVIVVFENGYDAPTIGKMAEELGGEVITRMESSLVEGEIALVGLSDGVGIEEAIEAFNATPGVRYAQPNFTYVPLEADIEQAALPIDPLAGDQWYLDKIHVGEAWEFIENLDLPARDKVKVCVADTSIQLNHEDLAGNMNASLSRYCLDGTASKNYPAVSDDELHGTHVAGTIGAVANNGIGVAGVASGKGNSMMELYSAAVLGPGSGSTITVIAGLDWAIESGAGVVNMSLGSSQAVYPPYDYYAKIEREVIDTAVSRGIVVVCAAGNDSLLDASTPSDFESVISVIATTDYNDPSGNCKADFSDYGQYKDISAPGVNIVNAVPTNSYDSLRGTSMATPIVSGVVAMMKYVNPYLTVSEVKDILYFTATDLYTPGFDIYTGWGNVNAEAAVEEAYSRLISNYPPGAPQNLAAKNGGPGKAGISWDPVTGASGYCIYRSETFSKYDYTKYHKLTEVYGKYNTSYTDTEKIYIGGRYNYAVTAILDSGEAFFESDWSEPASVDVKCVPPPNFTAKGVSKSAIQLDWDTSKGADGYYIYRSDTRSGGYKFLYNLKSRATAYKDTGLKADRKYYYKVIPYTLLPYGETTVKVKGETAGPAAGKTKA